MWICIAPRREHISKVLSYGTSSQQISQFYLHTAHSSANGMNHWDSIRAKYEQLRYCVKFIPNIMHKNYQNRQHFACQKHCGLRRSWILCSRTSSACMMKPTVCLAVRARKRELRRSPTKSSVNTENKIGEATSPWRTPQFTENITTNHPSLEKNQTDVN